VLLGYAFLRPAKSGAGAGAEVGRPAPLFASTDLSGRPLALSDYRGHRVVLNFWASWCQPCRAEFPVLRQMKSQHPDVVVLGVVFQDAADPARAFLRDQAATWPGVRDPKAQIADAYGVHAKPGIPVSILIDPAGRVRDVHYGPLADEAAAEAFLSKARPTS
jgi:peroxiredoxin